MPNVFYMTNSDYTMAAIELLVIVKYDMWNKQKSQVYPSNKWK